MTLRNGKVYRVEDGTPGVPHGMRHLEIHRACDRFLAARGIIDDPTSRRNAWLFGIKRRSGK